MVFEPTLQTYLPIILGCSVDPVNIEALWRLFSCGLAFVAASAECLGVALDDHGLKLGNFLLSLGIRYIG